MSFPSMSGQALKIFSSPVFYIMCVSVVTTLPAFVTMATHLLLLWPPQLHYLRLPKDISEDHVILMDSTVSTGAAAMMAVRVLLVRLLSFSFYPDEGKYFPSFIPLNSPSDEHAASTDVSPCFLAKQDHEVQEDRIVLVSLLMAELGVHSVAYAFPKVKIVTTAVDKGLDDMLHVVPGIGKSSPALARSLCETVCVILCLMQGIIDLIS